MFYFLSKTLPKTFFFGLKTIEKTFFCILILDYKLLKTSYLQNLRMEFFVGLKKRKNEFKKKIPINNKILVKFMDKNNILTNYISAYLSNFIQFL